MFHGLDCNLVITSSEFTLSNNNLTIHWEYTQLGSGCPKPFIVIKLERLECNSDCVKEQTVDVVIFFAKFVLEPCGKYRYIIYDALDQTKTPQIINDLTALEKYEIVNMTTENESPTDLKVNWEAPAHPLCLKSFVVRVVSDVELSRELTLGTFTELFDNLQPCESYVVSIKPINYNNVPMDEYESSVKVTMSFFFPGKIRDLSHAYNSEEKSVAITWLEPIEAKKCIESYRVEFRSDPDVKRPRFTNFTKETFSDVFACVTYTIEVIVVSILNTTEPGVTSEVRIPSRGENLYDSR